MNMTGLWTPPGAVVTPTVRKDEGGSQFDDELETREAEYTREQRQSLEMRRHLNARPDHLIFVSSTDARQEIRKVIDYWYSIKEIGHKPTIKVDYGIRDGEIRIGEH